MSSVLMPLQAQTYDKWWKQVERLQQKDLPKSVVSEAMKIYDKAKAEQNVPQMMKAYLTAMQYRTLLSPDSLKVDVKGLENWAGQAARAEDKAVLYSILAEVTMPDSLEKAFGYLQQSLEDRERLAVLSAEGLKPMVRTGDASRRYFRDNLYDLLARRAIGMMQQYRWQAAAVANQTDALPAEVNDFEGFRAYRAEPVSGCDFQAAVMQAYRSLLELYDTPDCRAAWLLTAIDALNSLHRSFPGNFPEEVCRKTLRSWIRQYADVEVMAEACLSLADFLNGPEHQVERLKVVREGMAKYPRYAGANRLKNIEREITNAYLALQVEPAYPGKMHDVRVKYKNLSGFTLQLYKVNLPVTSAVLENRAKDFLHKHAALQKEEHFDLTETADYWFRDTVLRIQTPRPGIYCLRAVPDGKKGEAEGTLMYVTSLQVIHRPLPGGGQELVVVDAATGQPVRDAEIVTYRRKGGGYMPLATFAADKEGTVVLDFADGRNLCYNARIADDVAMPVSTMWRRSYGAPEEEPAREVATLFTDRSIYRPGQTVYVSGLVYGQQGDSTRALADKSYSVVLYDANNNEIGKTDVKTNAYGSFSGQFALPSPCLTGLFRLAAGTASASFRVEEYKRPSFDVAFEPVKGGYRIGDSISVAGVAKTFAGAPLQHASVRYAIVRAYSWFYRRPGARTARWEGQAVTDAEGRFEVPVRLDADPDMPFADRYYTYRITADVTGVDGETQQGMLSLPLGTTSVVLEIRGMENEAVKEKLREITFAAFNLSGEPVAADVPYRVYELDRDGQGSLREGRCVSEAVAPSNKAFLPDAFRTLPSGRYRLKARVTDGQGRECAAERDFVWFSLADKRPPVAVADWFYQDGNLFDAQSPAALYIGSSEKDVYLLYDVFAGNRRIDSKRIHFSDSVLCFRFPYLSEYGNGVTVSMAFVKGGKLYSHVARIVKPEPNKKLQLKWTAFRDRLRPGAQEEWRLRVLHPDGRPADAELLAMMYDASLDRMYGHRLSFGLRFPRSVPHTYWSMWRPSVAYLHVDFPLKRLEDDPLEYSELLAPLPAKRMMTDGVMVRSYAARPMLAGSVNAKMRKLDAVEEAAVEFEDETVPVRVQEETGDGVAWEEPDGEVPLRENFAETAFFYPRLRTDGQGEASISFVLPESLTQWKFMGLAHTRDMDYGQIEATATASKDFMLRPNMPRFVRAGDKAVVAASLVNLSGKAVEGTVRMELFHPETEKVFYSRSQRFAIEAGGTARTEFAFDVTDTFAVLACRMVADGGTFADGEQHYIPVLTGKQWVTESVPLDVAGSGTHVFSLKELFNSHSRTASGQRMTVEFTGNPAWYAVQALPVVADPVADDALSWAAAYYANALAGWIVKSNPAIKNVLDGKMAQGGTKETFMSRLQKNEELKDVLLAETPWLSEAANETEQLRRMVTLFDLNAMKGKLSLAAGRLKELQLEDGSWSWYKGMDGNRYVTTQVVEWLARLQAMTGGARLDDEMAAMYRKALGCLAKEAREEYKAMKRAEKEGAADVRLSEQAVRYLYICALNGNVGSDADVNSYLIGKLGKQAKELTIYGKALGAIVLHQAGKPVQAEEFMQSLMEYSVATDEMGRYFDTPKAQYARFGYKIPTEVAAMEAVWRIAKDSRVLNQMKRWLLKQKQVQAWVTPVATVDAVHALLCTGTDLLADTGQVKIVAGKEVIETPAGDRMGYVKQVVGGDVMDIKEITVERPSAGLGWGAVHVQYWERLDRVKSQGGNALSISRELYKEGNLLDGSTPLNVGDRLTVRLTVHADRDMDFVQVKDERAACMEPLAVLSGYRRGTGLGYYQATKDASTSFFIDHMRKGTYVIEYQVYITRSGTYRAGVATIRSAYAPEFGGHTGSLMVDVK